MINGIRDYLLKMFKKDNFTIESLTIDEKEDEVFKKLSLEFKKSYELSKNIESTASFHDFAVAIVIKRMKETEYGKHNDFIHEIKYFVHYLFLVLQDDYLYGDKYFEKKLTQFENYIFSKYRKVPELKNNIEKLTILSYSNRFVSSPKDNLLAYFVFLEENGIEIIVLLEDFYNILDNKKKKKKPKKVNDYYKTEQEMTEYAGLNTVHPTLNETSKIAKIKIFNDNLEVKPKES